jgi:hypothetical protein
MTATVHISLMMAVEDAPAASAWYQRALGASELWSLGGVAGLEIEGGQIPLAADDRAARERAPLRVRDICRESGPIRRPSRPRPATSMGGTTSDLPRSPGRVLLIGGRAVQLLRRLAGARAMRPSVEAGA